MNKIMSEDLEKEIQDALNGKKTRPVREILEDANIEVARLKVQRLRERQPNRYKGNLVPKNWKHTNVRGEEIKELGD